MSELIATAEARAERIRAGADQAKAWIEDVMQAAVEGDWRILGYGSWQDYCDDVIGERVQYPRGERQEIVGRMREAGMSTRAIGAALGVDDKTVRNDQSQYAPAENSAPDSDPQPVTGIDGKTYTQPPRSAPPPVSPPPEPELPDRQDEAEEATAEVDQHVHEQAQQDARRDAELDAAMDDTDTRFRANFSRALSRADDVWQFDTDRIAELHAADFDRDLAPWLEEMSRWCERVSQACKRKRSGLRVVNGGQS